MVAGGILHNEELGSSWSNPVNAWPKGLVLLCATVAALVVGLVIVTVLLLRVRCRGVLLGVVLGVVVVLVATSVPKPSAFLLVCTCVCWPQSLCYTMPARLRAFETC